jgi:serine/threonine-protein kinase HipA
MMGIDGKEWIIKFPAYDEGQAVGKSEYDYSLCAKECGIDMTPTRLFPSDLCAGYFGIERFDKEMSYTGKTRIHVLTAAALLELDYKQPSLDYHELMKLTKILTKGNAHHLENMFRRACFNVYAHNRDDHSKNFSFLYDEQTSRWHLSPAYDLTHSTTFYGEHTTSVDGNGKNPSDKELLNVGLAAGMGKKQCLLIISEIKEKVSDSLSAYIST